ncbi:MAG: hypothetical protein ACRCV6_06555 [Formosimonas sp.]
MTTVILHQATMDVKTLRQALQFNGQRKAYNWRNAYPILAELNTMATSRSATIFPNDCPNTALDCFVLERINMPIDAGMAVAQAAALGVPAAVQDLQQRNLNPWFCLTPVHWQAGRDKVHLVELDDIDVQEAKQLLEVIAPWLNEWDWHVHVTAPNQWFVRANAPFDYQAPSLAVAQSDQLEHFLPQGQDLKRWQTLLTEIQMAWHEHPVNQARQANGRLPINSVWLDNTSSALKWMPNTVKEWQETQKEVQTFSLPNVHDHLAELNVALAATLIELNQNQTATFTLLGDNWQQDITFKKITLWTRIKNKMRRHKPAPLNWLVTPKFDFLDAPS